GLVLAAVIAMALAGSASVAIAGPGTRGVSVSIARTSETWGARPLETKWRTGETRVPPKTFDTPRLDRNPFDPQLPARIVIPDRMAGGERRSQVSGIVQRVRGLRGVQGNNPADAQVGVGGGRIVEMVNTSVKVWDMRGRALRKFSLGNFISDSADDRRRHYVSDPRVLFDPASQRWFAL